MARWLDWLDWLDWSWLGRVVGAVRLVQFLVHHRDDARSHAATAPYAACSRLQPGVAPSGSYLVVATSLPLQRTPPHASVPPSCPSHELLRILVLLLLLLLLLPPAARRPLPTATARRARCARCRPTSGPPPELLCACPLPVAGTNTNCCIIVQSLPALLCRAASIRPAGQHSIFF